MSIPIEGTFCNVLVAKTDKKTKKVEGAIENTADFHDWHCIDDPLMDVGMEYLKYQYFIPLINKVMPLQCEDTKKLIKKLIKNKTHEPISYIQLFTLQMGYVFLWTILDRYKSLKYGLNRSEGNQNSDLAKDSIWKRTIELVCAILDRTDEGNLLRKVPKSTQVYLLTYTTSESVLLDNLYNVRCNAVHRGKAVIEDRQLLCDAFLLLYVIMSYIITYDVKRKKGEAGRQLKEDCQAIKNLLTPV